MSDELECHRCSRKMYKIDMTRSLNRRKTHFLPESALMTNAFFRILVRSCLYFITLSPIVSINTHTTHSSVELIAHIENLYQSYICNRVSNYNINYVYIYDTLIICLNCKR